MKNSVLVLCKVGNLNSWVIMLKWPVALGPLAKMFSSCHQNCPLTSTAAQSTVLGQFRWHSGGHFCQRPSSSRVILSQMRSGSQLSLHIDNDDVNARAKCTTFQFHFRYWGGASWFERHNLVLQLRLINFWNPLMANVNSRLFKKKL